MSITRFRAENFRCLEAIEFEPDPKIFKDTEFRPEHVEHRLRHYSFLNTGLKLVYNGKTFQSRLGLMDLVMEDMGIFLEVGQAQAGVVIVIPLMWIMVMLQVGWLVIIKEVMVVIVLVQ